MSELNAKIREIFSLWQRDLCPGGQVQVRKNGEIIFDECFGYADIERKVKVTPDTVFHVASVSKQITTMSILLLRERGLIDIDKDIRTYIPDLIAFKEPITVRNMMNNISGIRDQWVLQMYSGVRMTDVITQSDLLYLNARQREINFPPCSKYLYSNTNFVFLSEIVRRISGMPLSAFAKENIFKPLKMDKTLIRDDYDQLIENRALSYADMGDGTFKWKPLNYANNGATSLHTTANDFMKWLANFENPVICSQETLDIMMTAPTLTTGEKSTYACGLQLDEKSGHRSIGHGGADACYRAHVLHFPDDKLDIVALSNTENVPMGYAAQKIADVIFGTDSFTKKSEVFTEEEIAPVLGDFTMAGMPSSTSIYEQDGKLMIKSGKRHMPLIHEQGNRYAVSYLMEKIYFKDGAPYFEMLGMSHKLVPILPANFTAEQLGQLAGTYYSDEIEAVYSIDVECGKAKMRHKRFGSAEIFTVGDGVYYCPLEKEFMFRLIVGEKGEIQGLTFSDGRILSFNIYKVDIKR